MVDRIKLRTTSILEYDRQTLHQYGFNDLEIDRLRAWVMSSPWEINEVNAAYKKVAKIKEHIDAMKKSLSLLTATIPALTLELNHINKQVKQNSLPSIIEGFSFMEAAQTPNAKNAEQELLTGLNSLELTITHHLQTCKTPMLIQYGQTQMEITETTGKEWLLLGLRGIWAQKHPDDHADASNNFIDFIAILFMSSDEPDGKTADPNICKGWWNNIRTPDLKTGKRLRFPIISHIDDQGNITYLSSPPTPLD